MPEVEEGDYLNCMLNGETVELEVAYEAALGELRCMQLQPLPVFDLLIKLKPVCGLCLVTYSKSDQWTGYGKFSVEVKFDKEYNQDLFYFCHIHHGISGRIKLLKNDVPIWPDNFPNITHSHPEPSSIFIWLVRFNL